MKKSMWAKLVIASLAVLFGVSMAWGMFRLSMMDIRGHDQAFESSLGSGAFGFVFGASLFYLFFWLFPVMLLRGISMVRSNKALNATARKRAARWLRRWASRKDAS